KGEALLFARDEHPRADTTLESLRKLAPVFRADGTVTAGNSSGITDGAAAVCVLSAEALKATNSVEPQARVVDYEVAGVAPEMMGIGLAPAGRTRCGHQEQTLAG